MNNNQLRSQKILSMYSGSGFKKSESTNIVKGGQRAQVGEVRLWNGEPWVKHQDGWVNVSKKGKATIEKQGNKRFPAESHHIEHFTHHMGNNTPVEKTDVKNSERKEEQKPKVDVSKLPFNEENAFDIIDTMITKMGMGEYTLDGYGHHIAINFLDAPLFHLDVLFDEENNHMFDGAYIQVDFPEDGIDEDGDEVRYSRYGTDSDYFSVDLKDDKSSLKDALNVIKKEKGKELSLYNTWAKKAKKEYDADYKKNFKNYR